MRRARWTLAAAALLVVAAWLSSYGESRPAEVVRKSIEFPAYQRRVDYDRMQTRRTLVLPVAAVSTPAAGQNEDTSPKKRDPFLAALPARAEDPVVVLEANALRHSRLGELFVQCAMSNDPDFFKKLQSELGIDVLKDVDRVAFVGPAVVISGYFDRLRADQLQKETGAVGERYGEAGTLYVPDAADGSTRMAAGTWRDQILVLSDPATVRRALDQLEGRAPQAPVSLPDNIAYGELYGVIPGDSLRKLLRNEPDLLGDKLAAAANRIELHADAMQDIAAVATFRGTDSSAMSDLARAMGGVLAAARLQAQATGDRQGAELLDQASVVPGDGNFTVQVALPIERIESWFARCRPAGAP